MEEELKRSAGAIANQPPQELLHYGSGWGALEERLRRATGRPAMASASTRFPDDSLGEDQAPWLALLEQGRLPHRDPALDPGSLMVQPEWRDLLEQAVHEDRGAHWLAWYHLGVMRYRARDFAGAREAWERSMRQEPTAWACRDLAVLALEAPDPQRAADLWLDAARMNPTCTPLAIECAIALRQAGRAAQLVDFVGALPPQVRSHGRIRLLRAMAALELDDLDTVARYFEGDVDVANIREKETILSDLWFGFQAKRVARERGVQVDDELNRLVRREFPPPPRFDFRLNADLDLLSP
jgi:hypothetical protein